MDRVVEMYFLPPIAVARVGGSDTPLEAFVWDTDISTHGAHQTVIKPAVTLKVAADGSVEPYIPNEIRFRDGDQLRPAAPFFELWLKIQSGPDGETRDEPATPSLLAHLGVSTKNLLFKVAVGNCKAERRTRSPACSFIARLEVRGTDHGRKPLHAVSPYTSGETPLVASDRPIPLGSFQVMKPAAGSGAEVTRMGVDLSQIRVRFTPARGEVYGPPEAIAGPSSPVQPGEIVPAAALPGKIYEIVPERNRILNSETPWSTYIMDEKGQTDPQPCDSYDGADVGNWQSWGVVDDTCDGTITAELVIRGVRFVANARVLSGVPDFAPDRRPFVSLAGDLADRQLPPLEVSEKTRRDTSTEIADLFSRVFETATLMNLDAQRYKAVLINTNDPPPPNYPGLPQIGDGMMTKDDVPYVDLIPVELGSNKVEQESDGVPFRPLPYTDVARVAHAPLTDEISLEDFLRTRTEHVRRLVRPPYGRFWQLDEAPGKVPNPRFRDSRVSRDSLHDMRMPPFMRDSDENPLSLTWRDYDALMRYIDLLEAEDAAAAPSQPSND
ncbi:hypothetical protein [Bradyrhizobium ivorense]|uniref:hypothetical protein n=1 Tax=Bradyrhizobium ivorense TaxID=2511166 RepID=UPI0010B348C0|nr:hypothetical protein [Bradyrhizobium ivorense]VIO78630.1 hypothetical protein CI41S_64730 [Bradyrhizobium ivorense]